MSLNRTFPTEIINHLSQHDISKATRLTMPAIHDRKQSQVQKKAVEIFKRELDSAKKSRLQCLLEQQYITQYGTKKSNSQINNGIRRAISEFVSSARDLNSLTDPAVTSFLQATVKQAVEDIKRASENKMLQNERSSVSNHPTASTEKEESNTNLKLDLNQWSVVTAIERVAEEERKKKEFYDQKMRTWQFKNQLDAQKRELEKRREQERLERLQLSEEIQR